MDVLIRPATEDDVPVLAALYAGAARALGPLVYTAEQVKAWASAADDLEAFRGYVMDAHTLVGVQDVPVAFCAVADDGEVRLLYVRADRTRRGLGSLLLHHAMARGEARGATRFAAWATPFSRPVFERAGFRLADTVVEPFKGVLFERYRMQRP